MIKHTWKTKKSKFSKASAEFTRKFPTTVEDTDLITTVYGSIERVFECAMRQTTVDIAPGIRARLKESVDGTIDRIEADKFVATWVNDGTKDSYKPTPVSATAMAAEGITEAQIAWLRTKGQNIIDDVVEVQSDEEANEETDIEEVPEEEFTE